MPTVKRKYSCLIPDDGTCESAEISESMFEIQVPKCVCNFVYHIQTDSFPE